MLPGEMTLPEGILPLAGQAVNQLFHVVSLMQTNGLPMSLRTGSRNCNGSLFSRSMRNP